MSTNVPAEEREGFWRTLARVLGRFGDALDVTEAALLAERVCRLENDVAALKKRLAELR